MRILFACFLSAPLLAVALTASAQGVKLASPDTITEAPLAAISRTQKLDTYFKELKRTRDPVAASAITARIWSVWNDSGSATINLLMKWAGEDMKKQRYPAALDFLDEAIVLKPDYAESWNKRATLHFHTGNFEKSMSDIAHVLALEPRHFGALAGMATILEETGQDAEAIKVWERLLEIYPADRESQNHVRKLSRKLAGTKT